jgi:cytochrome c-type biogenesis protein CcmH/NrfF
MSKYSDAIGREFVGEMVFAPFKTTKFWLIWGTCVAVLIISVVLAVGPSTLLKIY